MKLRTCILILFLTLTSVSFFFIISFTYTRDYKSIGEFSKQIAEDTIAVVLEKFKSIALGSERAALISGAFLPELGPVSFENKALVGYLLNIVKYDTHFSAVYIGLPDGSLIGAVNERFWSEKTYVSDPSKLIPSSTAFSLRHVDRSQNPAVDYWYYLDDNFNEISSERISGVEFDARERPWYEGAIKTQGLYWTGFYTFRPTIEKGISIANPIFNKDHHFQGVVSADLTFSLLSQFLFSQKIGKTGKAFILDNSGQIIAPKLTEVLVGSTHITSQLVSEVYLRFMATPDRPDYILKSNGVEYIAYITKLPVIFGSEWMMLTVAPLDDFFGKMIKMQQTVIAIILGILVLSGIIIAYFANRISSPIVVLSHEINKISSLEMKSNVRIFSNIREIVQIDNAIHAMRRVIGSFAKYVPKEIVKDLFDKKEEIVIGGQKREVTIFFSDIEGFTPIAESNSIDVLIPLLTEYFDAMSKTILSSHGTIDKFLGDGIMAFWGAPIEFSDHTARACTAALRCQAMLINLNQRRREEGKPEFLTRFGINTGTVIVGNIGTDDRMNYTIIGDAVNTAARLQEVDKIYHTSIIISEDAHKFLGDEFVARPLDIVSVKGRKEKIKIYELMGKLGDEKEICPDQEHNELCQEFTEAFDAMQGNNFIKALSLFAQIAKKFPNDYPTQIYLQRLLEKRTSGGKESSS